jgi:protease-4
MKQFFKFMFASMLGFFLTFVIIAFISMGILFSVALSTKKEVTVSKNSVLHIELKNPVTDRTSNNPMENFDFNSFESKTTLGLDKILKCIKKAKTDDNIKGIYLDLSIIPSGAATTEEIRNALIDFKKSGKFIISYSEVYSQKAYYLASVSDKIYMNPEGTLIFKGLSANIMFFKGTLEKLDIKAQIIRHGKFKSAVEPFMLDSISQANREQTTKYISSIWNNILKGISETRKIDIDELNEIADNFKIQTPEDAVKYKFIDKLMYKDELLAELRNRLEIKENKKIKYMALNKYSKVPDKNIKKIKTKNKIAVIYASGDINSGKGDDKKIGSETISKAIRKARLDSSVKAIVLRVNSPGGSALASDVIWREMNLSKKTKPVVVSMGNVAASGGYYISCSADKIIAQPNTITGSIGVFGIIPDMKDFFNNKLGITFSNVKTNKYADLPSTVRPLTETEESIIQNEVERIYKIFIKHVAQGRNMTVAQVDSIGQGRVWTGTDAKEIGLIDDIGGIDKAIKTASELAKIENNYKIIYLPKQKNIFSQIFEKFGDNIKNSAVKSKLGDNYKYYKHLNSIINKKGVQARLAYDIDIN